MNISAKLVAKGPKLISDPDSAKIMAVVDAMGPQFRSLVHEYGVVIVSRMHADGYENAEELRGLLETWRERRQDQWLKTDWILNPP